MLRYALAFLITGLVSPAYAEIPPNAIRDCYEKEDQKSRLRACVAVLKNSEELAGLPFVLHTMYSNSIVILQAEKRYPEARTYLEKWVRLKASDADDQINMGALIINQVINDPDVPRAINYDVAVWALQTAFKEPKLSDHGKHLVFYHIGRVRNQQRQYDRAIESITKALTYEETKFAYEERSRAYTAVSDSKNAAKDAAKAKKLK